MINRFEKYLKEEFEIRKFVYGVSLIYSFFYGFVMLLVLDMVNHKVNFSPVFRYPSIIGIVRGLGWILSYILVMVVVKQKYKSVDTKRFILSQITIFIFGLILFWAVGAVFFIETPNCA